jgi:uncharacterized protein (TIGR03067 family)
MSVRVLLLSAAVLLAAGLTGPRAEDEDPEPPRSGLRRIQGDWEMASTEAKGKTFGAGKGRLTVKGDQWILGTLKDKDNPPTIKIDASKSPMTIDLLRAKGKGGPVWRGIFKLEGDTLTLCRTTAVSDERPTKFETTEQGGMIIVWKRVKK